MPCSLIGAPERMCPSPMRFSRCLAANSALEAGVAEAWGVSVGACVHSTTFLSVPPCLLSSAEQKCHCLYE